MSKIAVIYWSGTGNTQQMAEAIANQAHADLFTASEFTADKAANYDAFAFGCSAMGAEQLEEDEFEPMWNAVAPVLGSKKVVLFGSYGWGGGGGVGGRHTSMLVQPVGLSMIRMPSGIGCASFAPSIRRVCAVQAFRRKAEPCRRRNSFPPRI